MASPSVAPLFFLGLGLKRKPHPYKHLIQGPLKDHGCINYDEARSRFLADDYLMELLQKNLSPGDTVVELGCNRGNNLLEAARLGYKAYGVDLNPGVLKDLEAAAKDMKLSDQVTVAQWDFGEHGDLPWQGPTPKQPKLESLFGKCKAIFAVHVLSHLSQPGLIKAVQGLQHYLAPGGIFAASIIQSKKETRVDSEHDMRNGYVEHTLDTLRKAFKGFTDTAFSRPFHLGELRHWSLPGERIHWKVMTKNDDEQARNKIA